MVGSAAAKGRHEDGQPERRAVLLGASNLTRAISTVVETSRLCWGRPLEILGAMGHGRSYGLRSSVFGRELPGIISCELWEVLANRPEAPTAALLTDIGNDLLYDVPVSQIVEWTAWCLERLQRVGARTVLTRLPLCNLSKLTPLRFRLFRTVLFPASRLELETVAERAVELDQRLCKLAKASGVVLVEQRPEWYGFDPIHIKIRQSPFAWRDILAPWSGGSVIPRAAASLARWIALRRLAPARQRLFGFERRRAQPAARLADGTTLALF